MPEPDSPRRSPLPIPALLSLVSILLGVGCGGGQYGYARTYEPLSAEEPFMEESQRVPYGEVRRDPKDYGSTLLSWFGTVVAIEDDPDSGKSLVRLDFRTHRRRHLCSTERDSSCRVTVAERKGGPFTARVEIRPGDREGKDRLWKGSLVKVYGRPTGDFDERGGPVLETQWYRHWPHGKYVTTAASATMRR